MLQEENQFKPRQAQSQFYPFTHLALSTESQGVEALNLPQRNGMPLQEHITLADASCF